MRPQITFPKDLKRALNYHEKKVQKGTAELLHAYSFFKPLEELNMHNKLERFQELMVLNERAETKLIHISLNFHPSEKDRLTKGFFISLADEYMERIGFGNQPYLVYLHEDAAHPHIHILSTLIRDNGQRIATHYIAKNISEPARKEMEHRYGFIPADKKENMNTPNRKLIVNVPRIKYGKSETLRAITHVLELVVDRYKYASLAELNAVLKQFNVLADRGKEDGRIYKNGGLTYRIINEQGQKMGVPIKASAVYFKPTLTYLEKKFHENKLQREPDKRPLRTAIDWVMHKQPGSIDMMAKLLEMEKITTVLRRSNEGKIYGITYIDHSRKTVFNGSDLGKEYAAKRIVERLGIKQKKAHVKEKAPMQSHSKPEQTPLRNYYNLSAIETNPLVHGNVLRQTAKALALTLLQEESNEALVYELREELKRKKKRRFDRQQGF